MSYRTLLPKTIYICDGRKECSKSSGCAYHGGECLHTTTIAHAKYGTVEHPEERRDRFDRVTFNLNTFVYVEK